MDEGTLSAAIDLVLWGRKGGSERGREGEWGRGKGGRREEGEWGRGKAGGREREGGREGEGRQEGAREGGREGGREGEGMYYSAHVQVSR